MPNERENRRDSPAVPLVLGLAGLIPFWALAIALVAPGQHWVDPAVAERMLSTYAAIIISFLGGVRWGLVSSYRDHGDRHFLLAVLPSLLAWALLALPTPWDLLGLGIAALSLGPFDALMVRQGVAPAWLGRLRLLLSTLAGAALFVATIGSAHAH